MCLLRQTRTQPHVPRPPPAQSLRRPIPSQFRKRVEAPQTQPQTPRPLLHLAPSLRRPTFSQFRKRAQAPRNLPVHPLRLRNLLRLRLSSPLRSLARVPARKYMSITRRDFRLTVISSDIPRPRGSAGGSSSRVSQGFSSTGFSSTVPQPTSTPASQGSSTLVAQGGSSSAVPRVGNGSTQTDPFVPASTSSTSANDSSATR